ncbi:MAG: peptidoglycan DD-metalloendopeptidase family protein [Burkholderiaceae bacterium]|nr:peptidoglycan DD-metalloendopeptidase family protein [Burkholderiaceae bacterium]
MSLRTKIQEAANALMSALRASRKTRVISGMAAGLSLVAFGAAGVAPIAPDAADLPVTLVVEELPLPDLNTQIASLSPAIGQFIAEERVRPGDNLSALLERLGVNDPQAAQFIRSDAEARALLGLRPGRRLQATVDADGRLLSASALLPENRDELKRLVIERGAAGFTAKQQAVAPDRRVEMRSGEIRSSLFAATDAAQVPDAVAMQLVEIFSSDIDFGSDLRKGDRFQVVYETVWQDGELVRTGRVLAAEFRNAGKTFQAIWFGPQNAAAKDGGYYDLRGKALKKAFLKSPLPFSRVTSGFAMRVHPVSGQWKQHKGIDFAAPTGTPIRATGDGVIEFAGSAGGYGNLVVVRHGAVYSTAYAHMSRIAARRGAHVAQGDIIGYVGSTGWSTGPHLHYEFRVNNEARNPNSIAVPHAVALAGDELQRFRQVATDMGHRFSLMAGDAVQVAAR